MRKKFKYITTLVIISVFLIKGISALSIRAQNEQSIIHDLLGACNTLVLEKIDIGEYFDALDAYNQVMAACSKRKLRKSSRYTTLLTNVAFCYEAIGDNEQALKLYKEILPIIKKGQGTKHIDYGAVLNGMAICYGNLGNYELAINLQTEVLTIMEEHYGKTHPDYATSLDNLAGHYLDVCNYEQAIELHLEALSIREKSLGKTHLDYALSLNNIAVCYGNMGNYEQAIEFYSEALSIQEKCIGKTHPDYAQSLNNLAVSYSDMGNNEQAIVLQKEALAIREKCLGKTHPDYAQSLENLAAFYREVSDYEQAIEYHTEALAVFEKCFGKTHPHYAWSLDNLAMCYLDVANYEQAIKLNMEALSIWKMYYDKTHSVLLATSLSNLAVCYLEVGNYGEAIKLHKEALSVQEKCIGKTHADYATSLNNLAICYKNMGNYGEAIELHKEALSIQEKCLGKTHPDYAYSLSCLANCYCDLGIGEYYEAIELYKEALSIREKCFGKYHGTYAKSLSNLATAHLDLGNYEESIKLCEEALSIQEKRSGKTHPAYATSLNNLAACYSEIGDYEEAIKLYTEALAITEKFYGKMHPQYIISLESLACSYKEYDPEKLSQISLQLHELKSNYLKRHFSGITSSARQLFWNNEKYYFKEAIYERSYLHKSQNLIEASYNSALISKGIILDTEVEFSRLIAESKDEEALRIYKELQHTRTFLNKQYEKPVSERVVNTDSLETVAEELEEQLIERSQVYGDFTRNLSIDWKQVQKKLGKDDIAIEFVSFPINYDSVMYCALSLKKGYDAPKMIPLFESSQLDSVNREKYYESTALAVLVWKPLDDELKEAKNIYFAPDGELYNIAIESLPYHDGVGYMFDRWNLYRLSSTRELAKIKYHPSETKAALYGGLNYDTDITTIENSQQPFDELYIAQYRSEPDSIGLRARYGTLRGTWTEVQLIDSLYSNLKYPSKVYAHNIGTETSLKKLDGQKISNLHIATHGFYWTETELNEKEDLRELPFIRDNNRPRFIEDKAMTRSGLLFAGANKVLSGKTVPEGYDDGILTAKEISILDLRGLDLLVLSACQTGLGEIKGDGVYGLQRGFKMAGAQTIVMSLWKVDDDATQMLMTEFYKRYLSGQSKHDAFLAAQEVVRNFKGRIRGKDKNFSDPKYWAGFIMLD